MSWDAIGAIGEILGAGGVIATLIYLAAQLRETAASSSTQAFHAGIQQLIDAVLQTKLIPLLLKSEREPLSEQEVDEITAPLICFIYAHEILYYLYENEQVDEKLWENAFENNLFVLQMKLPSELLARRTGVLSEKLKAAISERETT